MHALLLIAHGSRREASNREVRDLAAELENIVGDGIDAVVPAFLELAEPDIPTGVDLCVEAGATTITAVPYFLSAGRHVAKDIPAELEKAALRQAAVTIRQSDYLGKHKSIPAMLLQLALDSSAPDEQHRAEQATG
jgi:sirohydrochlorin ferrochelatase